jgi:cytochrome c553
MLRMRNLNVLVGLFVSAIISPVIAADLSSAEGLYTICAECHGVNGVSDKDDVPNLAGQKKLYLYKQFLEFRAAANNEVGTHRLGHRTHAAMNIIGQGLTKLELESLARYLAKLPCSTDARIAPRVKPMAAGVCENCHGAAGVVGADIIPNIAGQKAVYLKKQLTAFRSNVRGKAEKKADARTFHLMDRPAARLSMTDVAQLSDYYASLSCSAN